MNIDLEAIKGAARGATPGPWQTYSLDRRIVVDSSDDFSIANDLLPENAHHIATMDPQTTLALVERVEELEALLGPTVQVRWDCFCGHAHKWTWREEDCMGSTKMYCEACGAATSLIVHPDGTTESPA